MKDLLEKIGLTEYLEVFEENKIDLEILLDLDNDDLKELIPLMGPRKKLIKAIDALKVEDESAVNNKLNNKQNETVSKLICYIAHAYNEYLIEDHPNVKLHWLTDTVEITIRWLCAMNLAQIQMDNLGELPESILNEFKKNIKRPTLGVWLNLLKKLSTYELNDPIIPELTLFYGNMINTEGLFPDHGDNYSSILKLRNRIAHGGGTTKKQSLEYLSYYDKHLAKLVKGIIYLMRDCQFYAGYNDTCYNLQGLNPSKVTLTHYVEGPFIKVGEQILSLWPLMDYNSIHQIDSKGAIVDKKVISPLVYTRFDKVGIQYTPLQCDASYSVGIKQKEFESIFALNVDHDKVKKSNRYEYQYLDYLQEAKYLKEELIGRREELKTIKKWIKSIDAFDEDHTCGFIHGGPGLGKSMLMASAAADLSNDNIHRLFYYRFRGGDARNSKYWFIKLLRQCLLNWEALSEVTKPSQDEILSLDEMLDDIYNRIECIMEIEPISANKHHDEIKPVLRILIDGLDEVVMQEPSMIRVIESIRGKGVVLFIASRLENGGEKLLNMSWIEPLAFTNNVGELPRMSNSDIRAMLLESLSKSNRKLLIESDLDNEDVISNPMVEKIAKKADGLPLYIHLLIHDLHHNKFSIENTNVLPDGLTDYYYELVGRMGINDVDSYKAPVVTLLSLVNEPIDIEAIAYILHDIEEAPSFINLLHDVIKSISSLLKEMKTPENTTGYTLYHQSFKEFILKGEVDQSHPLYWTVKKMKKSLSKKCMEWANLPLSNIKNHIFRFGIQYLCKWDTIGKDSCYSYLTNLVYLIERVGALPVSELRRLVNDYNLVTKINNINSEDPLFIWSSFIKENIHLISKIDEEKWNANQTLFQLAYIDGIKNSPLTSQCERLLDEEYVDFNWLKPNIRRPKYKRTGLIEVLQGHKNNILGALSKEDKIVTWSEDGTLRLWSISGDLLVIFEEHQAEIKGAVFNSEMHVVSWSKDNSFVVWNQSGDDIYVENFEDTIVDVHNINENNYVCTSKVIYRLSQVKKEVVFNSDFEISGIINVDSTKLLIWGPTNIVIITIEGDILNQLDINQKINGIILTSDDNYLVWYDNEIAELNLNGEIIVTYKGHSSLVRGCCFVDDEKLLSWSNDQSLKLWDRDGNILNEFLGHTGAVLGAIVNENGNIISWSRDLSIKEFLFPIASLRVWNQDGDQIGIMQGHTDWINDACLIGDGTVLTWSEDTTLRIWLPEGCLLEKSESHSNWSNGIVWEDKILSLSSDKKFQLWDCYGKSISTFIGHENWIIGALIHDDQKVLSWSRDKTVRLWDIDGNPLNVYKGHEDWVNGAIFIGDEILSWSKDSTLRLWHINGTEKQCFIGHSANVLGVIHKDESFISWSEDGSVILWSLDDCKIKINLRHSATVRGVHVDKNDEILTWTDDGVIIKWNFQGEKISQFSGHTSGVEGLLKCVDETLLSWSAKGEIIHWDNDGNLLKIFEGHKGSINGVLQQEDLTFISWSEDGLIIKWDLDGTILLTLEGHFKGVNGVSIDENNNLISWSKDATIRTWDQNGKLLSIYYTCTDGIKYLEPPINGKVVGVSGKNLIWSYVKNNKRNM